MNILAIDTCCSAATAAVLTDDRLAAEIVQNNKKTHSQNIMPMIDFMMSQAEMSIGDIDCFAAAVGPGSFTGVRIGVATVKALAHAFGKPCAAVSALHAMAYNVADFGGIICPIFDARRGQVYNALFGGSGAERLTPDRAISAKELCDELDERVRSAESSPEIIFLGDGLPVFADMFNERFGKRAVFAKRSLRMNLAASVAEIGYEKLLLGDVCGYAELKPMYLRLSQAEREKAEREKLNRESNINEK